MFDPQKARCMVRVFKDGVLATVGHDLLLELKDFHLKINADLSIEADARTDSLAIAGAWKNGAVDTRALSADDMRTIKKDLDHKILDVRRYPNATFRSTSVTELPGGRWRVAGKLSLHGAEKNVEFSVETNDQLAVAKLTVHQPSFGIAPFRALLGALKIKPDVIVEVTVPLGV